MRMGPKVKVLLLAMGLAGCCIVTVVLLGK